MKNHEKISNLPDIGNIHSAVTIPDASIIGPENPTLPIPNDCANGKWKTCPSNVNYDACSYSMCRECEGIGFTVPPPPNAYGIVTSETNKYETVCPGLGNNNATCECNTYTTYECGSGYYGTAKSETTGCTKCPSNATCAGGNSSTFICNKNYYKNGSTCTPCPSPGITEKTGVTDIKDCFIPSGTTFSDSTGNGIYTQNCYYTK